MQITYGETRAFTAKELEELFLSVKWESGNHPKLLQKAMRGYQTVLSARDGEKLVGLLCAMDDGAMTAYAHYLLVDPAYPGQGIGTHLVKMLKKKYRGYLRVALIAENAKIPFYKKNDFVVCETATPMYFIAKTAKQ